MNRKILSRLLAGAAGFALAVGSTGQARATFYAYAVQQTDTYTFTGATVGTLTPLSSTSSAQVGSPSGSEAHTGGFDSLQSYVGTARPAENTFTALGQVNPDYARGDALVTAAPSPFTTNNVAEAYMTGPGNSAGTGSWAVSAPVTLTASGALTLGFHYTNRLTLSNTGSPVPGTVAADYGYKLTIQDAAGAIVFTSSPTAINNSVSLSAVGSLDLPGSGTISIVSSTLAAGTYTATISGSEHTFITSVPEPASLGSLAVGLAVVAGGYFRRGRGRGTPHGTSAAG